MQGYSHALTGAAGWLAVSTATPISLGWYDTTPEVALTGAVMCAGAALLPDADHHSATIAYSLPPFTKILCRGMETISGGHRHGTHSLIGIAAFTLFAWMMSFITIDVNGRTVALGAGLIAVPLVAFAMQGLKIKVGRKGSFLNSGLGAWIISLGTAGAATYFLDYTWTWLPLAMGLGAFIHCVGDALTIQGVPWLWPLNPAPPKALRKIPVLGGITGYLWQPNGYFRTPILNETGSWQEATFGFAVSLYILWAISLVMGFDPATIFAS